MEKHYGRKLRGFVAAAILALLVGAATQSAPVRADGGNVGGPPPSSMVTPTN